MQPRALAGPVVDRDESGFRSVCFVSYLRPGVGVGLVFGGRHSVLGWVQSPILILAISIVDRGIRRWFECRAGVQGLSPQDTGPWAPQNDQAPAGEGAFLPADVGGICGIPLPLRDDYEMVGRRLLGTGGAAVPFAGLLEKATSAEFRQMLLAQGFTRDLAQCETIHGQRWHESALRVYPGPASSSTTLARVIKIKDMRWAVELEISHVHALSGRLACCRKLQCPIYPISQEIREQDNIVD